jgi:hypothetical protein
VAHEAEPERGRSGEPGNEEREESEEDPVRGRGGGGPGVLEGEEGAERSGDGKRRRLWWCVRRGEERCASLTSSSSPPRPRVEGGARNGDDEADASESRFAGELDARAAATVECRSSGMAAGAAARRNGSAHLLPVR